MLNKFLEAARKSRRISQEEDALPFGRQLVEMAVLFVTQRMGPGMYHQYRLWDRNIPWSEKKDFWYFERYEKFLDEANPIRYRIIAKNKIVAKALIKFHGLPDSEYLGQVVDGGVRLPPAFADSGYNSLEQALQSREELKRICFKPVEGSFGEGFRAADVERKDGTVTLVDFETGARQSVDDYVKDQLTPIPDGYLIEQYINQHPDLSIFNPSSVNTLRVWIAKNRSDEARIIGIFLRVGRDGSLVDNRRGGGFGIAVDMDSFETSLAIPQDGEGPGFTNHPDSGTQMTGRKIPFKKEIEDLSFAIMDVLPSIQFVGLDVAVTPDGPLLVELNLTPTATGANVFKTSHKRLLGWVLEP